MMSLFLWAPPLLLLCLICCPTVWSLRSVAHDSMRWNERNAIAPSKPKPFWLRLRTESESLDHLRRKHAREPQRAGPQRNYEEIYNSKVDGIEISENDIIVNRSTTFHTNMTFEARNFLINARYHWPTSVIPVIIDPEAPYNRKERALIMSALSQYHLFTCIRFTPRTTEEDYVFITHDVQRGCSSNVGRQGGRQNMYLRIPGCVTLIGTAIHEMLHNLGFFHEHSRPDRDASIKVVWKDITPGYENNFDAYSPAIIDTLGQPYDYDSVMQYSAIAFSKDQLSYTIYPYFADTKRLGQRLKFSETDIKKVNVAYKCSEHSASAKTLNRDTFNNPESVGSAVPNPGIVNIAGVCSGDGPIDAAVMDSNGDIYIFKKGYYWVFNETSPAKFTAKSPTGRWVAKPVHMFLPKTLDTIVLIDRNFYFFSNNTVSVLTSLNDDAVIDTVPTKRIFQPIDFTVRGFFTLENQLFISNGTAAFLYNPVNDAVLNTLVFPREFGFPANHDIVFGIGRGRLIMIKNGFIFLTKPGLLAVEQGFPRTFQSVFC
ncbi:putative Zinc metalloproteinase nas-14 [Hypsibius exemplaris]|uniref:Metalloendopeptidase n=1 Tax=Hypsibius exemplaris TaxID=2072580 RepID=A0A1W0WLI5_HYPEX|nr:putative Zinc metalloproteinase nas-14 [Hypsibius exemplaris]